MHSSLLSWSRLAYLAGLVLALVLFIPAAWFPLQLGKTAVFAVCALLSLALFAWGGGLRGLLMARGALAALAVGALPLAYALSAFFSVDRSVGLSGLGLDVDTVAFVSLAFVAFVLAFAHFKTLRTLRALLAALAGALALAIVFQYVSILFGAPIGGADRSINLIGKWNDLGLLAALLAVLVLCRLELGMPARLWRGAGLAALALIAALLVFINFALAWALVLAAAVAVGLAAYLARAEARMPRVAIAAGAVAAVALIFGATFNTAFTSVFPVSSLEVRPSAAATLELAGASFDGSLARHLVGMGPNTFARQWMMLKPLEVNQTQFWSLDFNVGYSTLLTALLSVGVLGLLAWLVPLALVLGALVRVLRMPVLGANDRADAAAVGLAALFAYAMLAFYVPSANLILVAFALSGAAFGFLWRQGRSQEEAPAGRWASWGLAAAAVLLIALVAWAAFVGVRRFTAMAFVGAGQTALSEGRVADALDAAMRAERADETPAALRLGLDARVARLGELARQTAPSASLQSDFAANVEQALALGQRALELSPQDYRTHLSIASLYDLLAALNIDGAYQSARAAYDRAAALNSTSPAIPLLIARLEAAQQNDDAVDAELGKALTLKPNYTDAMLFAVQLAVARNDLPGAIRSAESAAQTAPGVASIWFQLGLLHYAGGNMAQAIPPLEQAVALVPDYANAKYFLGIAYYAEDRPAQAIALFEDLARTNPDSTEVRAILANMRAGAPALDGVEQSSQTAPVAE